MKLFFSVGEPSGDVHGANLIRALKQQRPDVQCVGFGGPKMAAAGCQLQADLTQLAIMWFLRALLHVHRFALLLWQADRSFRRERPDAVVLIDFPGFNWWVARRAKAHGIPVFYYGTPQVWAWAQWRVNKMRRLVDHVLCKLPFEVPWYEQHGVKATFVGHPFYDEVRRHELDQEFLHAHDAAAPTVAILPGSRTQEVLHNFKPFLKTAELVAKEVPQVRFVVAAFREDHATLVRQMIAGSPAAQRLSIEVFVKRTPELIHLADCCLAVSGSVSLELLYYARPTVIHYWISPLANWVQSYMRKVKFITLVNLLVAENIFRTDRRNFDPEQPGEERFLFPEYLTSGDCSRPMAAHLVRWLNDAQQREQLVADLKALREQVGDGGASIRGAEYIQNVLARRSSGTSQRDEAGRRAA